jgi:hypothetical protein
MVDTIANMTIDELKRLIYDLMEKHRLQTLQGEFDREEAELAIGDDSDNRTLEEVFASIERNRWTPPLGTPSPSQMIHDDRESR